MDLNLQKFKSLNNYSSHQEIVKQYLDLQYKHQDSIIFFRIGEFYEIFLDNAELVAGILSLHLTS
ncbi:MAG: hypothetical protein SFT91_02575, partial [Rickettsiaceae bacterium]|nr:hypothetical protein [Rickettsiaceae bacterium]